MKLERRADGRSFEDLRPCEIISNYVPWAAGSVLIRFGFTEVLCNVSISDDVPGHRKDSGAGWLSAEYSMLPHAGMQRSPRDGRPLVSGRTQEIQRIIGRSLRAGLNFDALGPKTIRVDCDVLKADGGTRTAAVTGSWIALRHALNRIFDRNPPAGLLEFDLIAAVSVGIVDGNVLMDLNYVEDSQAEVDMNLVMGSGEKWIDIQASSEKKAYAKQHFLKMYELAESGIEKLWNIQRSVL